MNHIFRARPSTIDDLKKVVEDFAEAMDSEFIGKVCSSARTRFEMKRKWFILNIFSRNKFGSLNIR